MRALTQWTKGQRQTVVLFMALGGVSVGFGGGTPYIYWDARSLSALAEAMEGRQRMDFWIW